MLSVGEECEKGGFTFIWTIEKFSHCVTTKGSSIDSTQFYMPDLDTTFYLQFCPRGKNDATKSECLLQRTTNLHDISFYCKMCICTTSGEILYAKEGANTRMPVNVYYLNILFDRLIDDSFPQDRLVFHCHLWKPFISRIRTAVSLSDTPVYCHAETQIKVQKKFFLWKIPEFSSLLLKNENVLTMKSVEEGRPPLTFKLSLRGSTVEDASLHIIIHFDRVDRKTFFTCTISLLDHSDISAKVMSHEDWLEGGNTSSFLLHFLTRRELMMNKASYLPDDVLSLKCEVTVWDGNHNIQEVVHGKSTLALMNNNFEKRSSPLKQISKDTATCDLQADLRLFFNRGILCDFELIAGGKTFPVHRIILSVRSPVFSAMFENDMLEKAGTSLDIPDLDSDTLHRMVRYIYTDAVPDLDWKEAASLYFAADKYQLRALRGRCSTVLRSKLESSNAIKILSLADRHQDGDLKMSVQDFMFNCGREAFNAEEWKLLEVENPQLAFETMRRIFYEKVLASPLEMPST